jgi:hypothetical protein
LAEEAWPREYDSAVLRSFNDNDDRFTLYRALKG